jgi:hypothetical protein
MSNVLERDHVKSGRVAEEAHLQVGWSGGKEKINFLLEKIASNQGYHAILQTQRNNTINSYHYAFRRLSVAFHLLVLNIEGTSHALRHTQRSMLRPEAHCGST